MHEEGMDMNISQSGLSHQLGIISLKKTRRLAKGWSEKLLAIFKSSAIRLISTHL